MSRLERIREALAALSPVALEIEDESHRHKNARESHYNVMLVTGAFEGKNRVERHRCVHELLASELKSGLHALTLTLRTPAEHQAAGGPLASPSCMGGSQSSN
jgi:stress-induced morphogen